MSSTIPARRLNLRDFTPARVSLPASGHSIATSEVLNFQLAHAQARDAVHAVLHLPSFAQRVRRLEIGPDYDGVAMTRRLLNASRGVIVHSHFVANETRTQGFEGPIAVIPHGVDVSAFTVAGDPFEAAVGRLWRAFVTGECDPVLRQGEYGLYTLRIAPAAERADG